MHVTLDTERTRERTDSEFPRPTPRETPRAVIDLGRWLLSPSSGKAQASVAEALGTQALSILGDAPLNEANALIASDAYSLVGRALTSVAVMPSNGARAADAFEASLTIQLQYGTPADVATDRSNLAGAFVSLATFDLAQAKAENERARRAAAEKKDSVRKAADQGALEARQRANQRLARALELLEYACLYCASALLSALIAS